MPTKSERTALLFVSGVLLVGAGARLLRASRDGVRPPPAASAALASQRRMADSLAHAPKGKTAPRKAPGSRAKTPRATPSFPIDLDRASAAEIELLPRIGPALAARIVADREAKGPFGSMEALEKRVRGVGPAMTKALSPLVTFNGR